MTPDQILSLVRPLVLVVDHDGVVTDAAGAYGGFLGHAPANLVGDSVFDHVAPHAVDELAVYFIESVEEADDVVSLPMPFRIDVVAADGTHQPVDIVVSGAPDVSPRAWVVTLVPLQLQTSNSRAIDAQMVGRPRDEVRRLLADELTVDNDHYRSRGFFVDLPESRSPSVTASRSDDDVVAEVIRAAVADGWVPWTGLEHGATAAVRRDELPDTLRAIADERGWRRVSATAVAQSVEPVAAILLFGRVPDEYPTETVLTNIALRLRRLADTTTLIMSQWRQRERLVEAANSDPLTGLANRRELLASRERRGRRSSAVMYIDVDDFKAINDDHGHLVGDQVLIEVARRIVAACRPADTVSRFGGDEFVVLLDDVDARAAAAVAERIVSSMGHPLDIVGGPASVSVSVGVASDASGRDALADADRAMLRAKRSGRGRVEVETGD